MRNCHSFFLTRFCLKHGAMPVGDGRRHYPHSTIKRSVLHDLWRGSRRLPKRLQSPRSTVRSPSGRLAEIQWIVVAMGVLSISGCWSSTGPEVVVYSALDREFSEPILDSFEQRTGIKVLANYDVESQKTVGLVNRIIQESNRPRCDVFWNNEILHALRLDELGLLQPHPSAAARHFPDGYRPADGSWHGFAARARVLIVNTEVLPDPTEWPTSVEDLAKPIWKDKVAIAKPLFGTTASHAAVLFAAWGDERARKFFQHVQQNAHVLSGNKQVAQSVSTLR